MSHFEIPLQSLISKYYPNLSCDIFYQLHVLYYSEHFFLYLIYSCVIFSIDATCANDRKKSWLCVRFNPGKSPLLHPSARPLSDPWVEKKCWDNFLKQKSHFTLFLSEPYVLLSDSSADHVRALCILSDFCSTPRPILSPVFFCPTTLISCGNLIKREKKNIIVRRSSKTNPHCWPIILFRLPVSAVQRRGKK